MTDDPNRSTPAGPPTHATPPTPPAPRAAGRKGRSSSTPAFPAVNAQRPAPLSDTARHAVFRVLARQAKLYPDFDLSVMDKSALDSPMSELDRAFAYAIYDAVVRHWLTLEYLISRELSDRQPWSKPGLNGEPDGGVEPRVKAALLGGAAQILLMDKVPTHAAINHAVEWAKQVIRPGAGGFVNAVLRKVARLKPESGNRRETYSFGRDELPAEDGTAIVLTEPCLPEDELHRIAVATSHPIDLLRHWMRGGGGPSGSGGAAGASIRELKRLALHSMMRPPVILNSMYARTPLPVSPALVPHNAPGHHVFVGTSHELGALLETRSDVWVQDPGSALAVQSVADLQPKLILDLCAGQGTKTRQLAAAFPNARIVTTDVDPTRLLVLERVFASSDQVKVMGRRKIQETYIGKADLVLLDVPCSNTGVLARRPEARLRFDEPHLKQLIDVQRQIIADTIALLADGSMGGSRGKILYSTCSLEAMENVEQVRWADKWHKLGVSRERRQLPEGQPGDRPPLVGYGDGSFAALLG